MDGGKRLKERHESLQSEGTEIAEIAYILQKKIKALESKKFKNKEIIRILKRDANNLEEKRKQLDKKLDGLARRRKR